MSWTDIFYPGNPGRRQEVVRLTTKLSTLMEFNFDATNSLADLINKHMKPNPLLTHIQPDYEATVKTNADCLIAQIDKIQKYVETIDQKLSNSLDPEIYRKLHAPDTSFKDVIATAKKAFTATISIVATAAGIALIAAMRAGLILKTIVTAIGLLKASVAASLVLGILTLGIDMIASAIIGAIEKDKLNDAIDGLKTAMDTFEPASKEYTKTITKVDVRLEIYFEDD